MRDYRKIYIDGEWIQPSGGQVLNVINPATEQPAGQITLATAADVNRAVAAARTAFRTFSQTSCGRAGPQFSIFVVRAHAQRRAGGDARHGRKRADRRSRSDLLSNISARADISASFLRHSWRSFGTVFLARGRWKKMMSANDVLGTRNRSSLPKPD
jgi:hypothetical protein